jgi:hypothetical protein
VLSAGPVETAGCAAVSSFTCEAVAEYLLLARETLREILALGGRRLLPPRIYRLAGPSSVPVTKGLTERSSM